MCCMWTSTQSSNLPMLLPLNDSFNSVIPSCKACSSKAFLSKKRNRIKSAKQLTALFWGSAVRILPFYSRVWSSKPDDVLKCKWITIIFPNIYVCNIISWSYMAHLSILCSSYLSVVAHESSHLCHSHSQYYINNNFIKLCSIFTSLLQQAVWLEAWETWMKKLEPKLSGFRRIPEKIKSSV